MAGGLALHDTIQQLVTIAYGIWRKRWYALATACLVSAVGWALVYTIPYKFESAARVQINADAIIESITKNGILRQPTRRDSERSTQSVKDEMTQRSRLEKIIRQTNYLERLASSELETNRLISTLKRDITILPSGENIYTIKYENDDKRLTDAQRADVARDVVANLVTIFITETTSKENVDQGIEFVKDQIQRLRDDLQKSDDAIARYKTANLEVLAGSNITSKLEQKSTELGETENDIAELMASVQALQKNLEEIPPTISRAGASGGTLARRDPLEERIDDLSRDRDKLFASGYKEKHPDVVNLTRQIEQLTKQLADKQAEQEKRLAESAEAGKSEANNTSEPNPVYEELIGQVLKQRAQLSRLQRRKEQETKDMQRLRTLAESAPEIEARYDRMRDERKSVELALRRQEQAKQDLDLVDQKNELDTLNFKVLDHPTKPLTPAGPPRLLYLTGMLIGGLIAGIGVALILSQIKPVVITVDQLRQSFDMPVLGNVTRVLSEKDTKARMVDLLLFGGVGILLVLAYIGLVMIDLVG